MTCKFMKCSLFLFLDFPGGSDGKASACKAGMREIQVLSPGREDPLEKAMAIHSSTLAWKIPWMEESDRLQSMGHKESDRAERLHFHTCYIKYFLCALSK